MTNITFGKEAQEITMLLLGEMPALNLVVWDLAPFIPTMHNWRRNIVFIECDAVAVEPAVDLLADRFPDHTLYAGIKKPLPRGGKAGKEGSIVIVARGGRTRREIIGHSPMLEKCLVDLLYYSRNEVLPLSLHDVLDLWEHYLTSNLITFSDLYRYSLRRYLGWFVSIFAYSLSKRANLNVDERHLQQGRRNLELLRMVSA